MSVNTHLTSFRDAIQQRPIHWNKAAEALLRISQMGRWDVYNEQLYNLTMLAVREEQVLTFCRAMVSSGDDTGFVALLMPQSHYSQVWYNGIPLPVQAVRVNAHADGVTNGNFIINANTHAVVVPSEVNRDAQAYVEQLEEE